MSGLANGDVSAAAQDFTRAEWTRIVEILSPPPEKQRALRRSLLSMREYAQDWAGLTVKRRRKAIDDLKAVSDALAVLIPLLDRLTIDAAPHVGRHATYSDILRPWGELPSSESLALCAILGSVPEDERRLLGADYLSGALHYADSGDVHRFATGARRLKELADSALHLLGRNTRGATGKRAFQVRVIGSLAYSYSEATGKSMSASKDGQFAELVSLVLGVSVERASAIILASRRPYASENNKAARAAKPPAGAGAKGRRSRR